MFLRTSVKPKSHTVPQRQPQRSALLVPCMNCEEFVPMDEIDTHSKLCTNVSKKVETISQSQNIFEESDYKLKKLMHTILLKPTKCSQRLCRIIELVIQLKTIGCVEEATLQTYEQELTVLSAEPIVSINQTLHIERLHSLILQRLALMQKQLSHRTVSCVQTQENFFSSGGIQNRSLSKVSLGSTNTTQKLQIKQLIQDKQEECNKYRQATQIYQSQVENLGNQFFKSSCLSPDGRMTYITKFSQQQSSNANIQQKSLAQKLNTSKPYLQNNNELLSQVSQYEDLLPLNSAGSNNPSTQEQREFYTLCLNEKMKASTKDPMQKIPLSLLWFEAQKQKISQKEWKRFVTLALNNPFQYLDPQKLKRLKL